MELINSTDRTKKSEQLLENVEKDDNFYYPEDYREKYTMDTDIPTKILNYQ